MNEIIRTSEIPDGGDGTGFLGVLGIGWLVVISGEGLVPLSAVVQIKKKQIEEI